MAVGTETGGATEPVAILRPAPGVTAPVAILVGDGLKHGRLEGAGRRRAENVTAKLRRRGGPGHRNRQRAAEGPLFHLKQAVNAIEFDPNLGLRARDDNVATRQDGVEATCRRAENGEPSSKLDRCP